VEAQSRFGDCNGRLPYIPNCSEEERHMTALETKPIFINSVFNVIKVNEAGGISYTLTKDNYTVILRLKLVTSF
jgi:hypothetical protein